MFGVGQADHGSGESLRRERKCPRPAIYMVRIPGVGSTRLGCETPIRRLKGPDGNNVRCGPSPAAAPCEHAVLVGGVARLGKGRETASAQSAVVALAVDGDALGPLFGAAGRNVEIQRVAGAEHAGAVDDPNHLYPRIAFPHDFPIRRI